MRATITKTEITCDACGINITRMGDSPQIISVGKIDLCSMCANEVISSKNGSSGFTPEMMRDKDSWGK